MAQNGVIVYMSCKRDLDCLVRSLTLLYQNFSKCRDYPVIIFHDDLTKVDMSNVFVALHQNIGYVPPKIKFEFLKFEFPAGFVFDPNKVDPEVPLREFWLGYRHMCRFHSGEIYKHPSLLQYDYYWRLDSDSYILSHIDYDPFDHMVTHGYEYAYMCDVDMEVPRVAKGLWEATKEFAAKNNVDTSRIGKEWDYSLYYTNFEISKFSFWRSPEYMAYYNHLDSTGNFYYQRWGDAPVHWLAVNMLMDKSKIWAVKDFTYQHNNWIKNLSSLPHKSINSKIFGTIDGTNNSGRRGRFLYALERYRAGGPDGVNWGD